MARSSRPPVPPSSEALTRSAPPPRLDVDDVIVVDTKRVRTAIGGTVVGNFMEWFDFGIYGYLAVTITAVFTADLPEPWGLLATLFGFAISFLVRPIGGLVLGPLGDRIGRQKVLFFTMAMMAAATALIGLLPTSQQIGLWAIIPLYVLKMIQGFSTGGEYAGATTYVAEFSPDKRRGFWSSWLDLGSYVGFAAGASVVALTTIITESIWGDTAMVDFGWRIPFLVAIPLGIVAIWFRLKIPETPAYENTADTEGEPDRNDPLARHGIVGILRHHWREVLIGIAIVAATNTAGYALTSYMPTYLEKEVGVSNLGAAVATVPVLLVMSACLPFIGRLSDRIGRRPVYMIAAGSTIVLMSRVRHHADRRGVGRVRRARDGRDPRRVLRRRVGVYPARALPDGIPLRCHGDRLQRVRVPLRWHDAAVQPGPHRPDRQHLHAGVLHHVLRRTRRHRAAVDEGDREATAPRVRAHGRDA